MRKITFVLLMFSLSISAFAHPHVWIESKLNISGNVINIHWKFDEMFSNIFYADFDIDGDKLFTGREIKAVRDGMFVNLRNFDYFFKAYCGNDMMDIDDAENFKLYSDKKSVSYSFSVSTDIKKCKKEVTVYHYDESYYSDISIMSLKGATLKDDVGGRKYMVISK